MRLKEDYDGAEPSAGALASLNILTLSNLLPDDGRMARLERALGRFGGRLGEVARVVPLVAAAASTWTAGVGQVVVSSTGSGDESTALRSALAFHYLPFIVAVPVTDTTRRRAGREIAVHRVVAGKGRRGDGVCLPQLRVPGAGELRRGARIWRSWRAEREVGPHAKFSGAGRIAALQSRGCGWRSRSG